MVRKDWIFKLHSSNKYNYYWCKWIKISIITCIMRFSLWQSFICRAMIEKNSQILCQDKIKQQNATSAKTSNWFCWFVRWRGGKKPTKPLSHSQSVAALQWLVSFCLCPPCRSTYIHTLLQASLVCCLFLTPALLTGETLVNVQRPNMTQIQTHSPRRDRDRK